MVADLIIRMWAMNDSSREFDVIRHWTMRQTAEMSRWVGSWKSNAKAVGGDFGDKNCLNVYSTTRPRNRVNPTKTGELAVNKLSMYLIIPKRIHALLFLPKQLRIH